MSTNILLTLKKNRYVSESYALLRQLAVSLDIDGFCTQLGIKIYLTDASNDYPYHYDVSHHVQTPIQAGPYYPSTTNFETEELAISAAIRDFTAFIESAIDSGHKPSGNWLIKNEDF